MMRRTDRVQVLLRAQSAGVTLLACDVHWTGGVGRFGKMLPIAFDSSVSADIDEAWLADVLDAAAVTKDGRLPSDWKPKSEFLLTRKVPVRKAKAAKPAKLAAAAKGTVSAGDSSGEGLDGVEPLCAASCEGEGASKPAKRRRAAAPRKSCAATASAGAAMASDTAGAAVGAASVDPNSIDAAGTFQAGAAHNAAGVGHHGVSAAGVDLDSSALTAGGKRPRAPASLAPKLGEVEVSRKLRSQTASASKDTAQV